MMTIPHQVIFEVFAWLPCKSLMRFKCISKFCGSLVFESYFMDIHECRSITIPGRTKLVVHESHRELIFHSIEKSEDAKINFHRQIDDFDRLYYKIDLPDFLECVNGLLCFWSWSRANSKPAVIFNPATREVRFLPQVDVDHHECHYSLGFEPEEKVYKVLFMKSETIDEEFNVTIEKELETYTRNWVYTLGRDKSWREINIAHQFYRLHEGICINGVIYMLNGFDGMINVVGFNVKDESFEAITSWERTLYDVKYYSMIKVKGKLALLESRLVDYKEINFLILGHDGIWETHIIVGFPLIGIHMNMCFCGQTYYDGEIIFVIKADKFYYFCYDITRKSWRDCQIEGFYEMGWYGEIYTYVESLYPIGKILQQ